MNTKQLILFALLLSSTIIHAQSWEFTYGHITGASWGYDIVETSDSGFIIIGDIDYPTGAIRHYIRVVKVDKKGIEQWSKIYHDGQVIFDQGRAIRALSNGEYIISGTSIGMLNYNQQLYLAKLNSTGDTLWTRRYGRTGIENEALVRPLPNGDFIIAGNTDINFSPTPVYDPDIIIIKTNAQGDTLWTRTYPYIGSSQTVKDIILLPNGNMVLCGTANGGTLVFKTNAMGDTLWTNTNPAPFADEGTSVASTSDGGIIVGGNTPAFVNYIPTLGKLDSTGTQIWNISPWNHGKVYDVATTSDNNIIVTGISLDSSFLVSYPHIAKLDGQGNILWSRKISNTILYGEGNSIIETSDGSYVVGGMANGDFYIVKMDSAGNILTTSTYPIADSRINVNVFPNPSTDWLTISFEENTTGELSVFSTNGQILFLEKVNNTTTMKIPVSQLVTGIYFYQITHKGETLYKGKFIKR